MYDLQNDPWETNNLADDPKHADLLKQLKTKITALQARTKDPWFENLV
ncbi:MAG: DUF4976 domain-containing protein [Armatimonadota bacterium]|nr:DUF4976 domain-containing protein [Armatimonadota bacterium]